MKNNTDQESNLMLFALICSLVAGLTRLGFWIALYYITKTSITIEFFMILLELIFVFCVPTPASMIYIDGIRKHLIKRFGKINMWFITMQEYNQNAREQKRKSKELFTPKRSTNIYHEILDDDEDYELIMFDKYIDLNSSNGKEVN